MGYAYASLTNPQNTGSGVAEFVLLAPVTAFTDDGIKCPAAPFTNPGDEVTVKEAHVFKSGEGFIKVQLAPQKNKLDATTIGDFGFTKLDINLEVFIPGSYAEVHEAVKNWMNKPLIVLIKDGDCKANMYYQLGCDCASAWLKVDFSTGTTLDGVKGYSGKLNYQNGYIQVYMGPAPQIKGSSVTPPVYDLTFDFTSNKYQTDQTSGLAALIPAASPIIKAKMKRRTTTVDSTATSFRLVSGTPGQPGFVEYLTIDGRKDYVGDPVLYLDANGVEQVKAYTDGFVQL